MTKTPPTLALSPLTALSPLDGRYEKKIAPLRALFSEYGLIRFRVLVEVRWLIALADWATLKEAPAFSAAARAELEAVAEGFSETDARRVKEIEATRGTPMLSTWWRPVEGEDPRQPKRISSN